MHKYISQLDSERFGFTVAKIQNNIENPGLIVQELKKLSTKLIIARVDLSNIKLINQLESLGFRYKDAQVTFNFNLHNNLPSRSINTFSLVSFNDGHLNEMIKITRAAFNNYGHYFADENLDKQKCSEIYVNWIQRCCSDKNLADEIVVAEKENVAIGYLAIKKLLLNDEMYYAGVIGAVAPDYRNIGVFSAINIETMYLAAGNGANHIENNVLITNFPVMKTYTNLNYNIIRSEITMHYWSVNNSTL